VKIITMHCLLPRAAIQPQFAATRQVAAVIACAALPVGSPNDAFPVHRDRPATKAGKMSSMLWPELISTQSRM
jgi:hypothetical protein